MDCVTKYINEQFSTFEFTWIGNIEPSLENGKFCQTKDKGHRRYNKVQVKAYLRKMIIIYVLSLASGGFLNTFLSQPISMHE
jgi:hypothetical protein